MFIYYFNLLSIFIDIMLKKKGVKIRRIKMFILFWLKKVKMVILIIDY